MSYTSVKVGPHSSTKNFRITLTAEHQKAERILRKTCSRSVPDDLDLDITRIFFYGTFIGNVESLSVPAMSFPGSPSAIRSVVNPDPDH